MAINEKSVACNEKSVACRPCTFSDLSLLLASCTFYVPFHQVERLSKDMDWDENNINQRLTSLEYTTYKGELIWKITSYSKKLEDELTGRWPVLTSPTFHTGQSGYRMTVQAYLNGDGGAKGSHLSMFFSLMKGQFDAILPWPFRHMVTITLFDQSPEQKNVEKYVLPDQTEPFERPKLESNIPVGFPFFVQKEILDQPNKYIKDDTMFIKVSISRRRLPS